jgi:hypothetical protein
MPAPPLAAYTRYIPPGTRKYYWVASIANPAAPTRAELNAGTDLSGQVAAVSGFALQKTTADVTPLGSQFTVLLDTILDANAGTNEIILYASASSLDARTLMPIGAAGFLVHFPEGDITGQLCEVWPASVNAMFFDPSVDAPGEIHFQYTITAAPAQNVTIP